MSNEYPQGPKFDQRIKANKAIEKKIMPFEKKGVAWLTNSGDYHNELLLESNFQAKAATEYDKLQGFEIYLANLIDKLQTHSFKKPLIIADLGGMVGLSWLKIAHSFQKEIRNSEMVFLVTNLGYTPLEIDQIPDVPSDQKELVHKLQGENNVKYLTSTLEKLSSEKITLPNGNIVSLKGNIDLVHERSSISAWSLIPEVDLYQIGSLLSSNAIYICHDKEPKSGLFMGNNFEHGVSVLDKYLPERRKALEIGRRTLQSEFGMELISNVEQGPLVYQAMLSSHPKVDKRSSL